MNYWSTYLLPVSMKFISAMIYLLRDFYNNNIGNKNKKELLKTFYTIVVIWFLTFQHYKNSCLQCFFLIPANRNLKH